ncbi:hypothetical protein HPG69_011911, partial [Diceros bicornis minor]
MNKRGKYTTLNLEEKMKVLSRIEAGRSLKSVMDEFGISKSTFYDIKKNKKLILDFVLKQDMPLVGAEKRKRTTGAKYGDVDDAVYMWYQQKRSAGVPVRGVELQAAAERFAQCFGRTDFKASTGWLFRFRNRHAIGNQKVCGEQVLSSASENVEPFRQKLFHEEDVRALLLLDSSPVHPSTESLTKSDDEQDKGEKGVSKIKIYNITSAIFNWAKSWDEVKQITIANAWENLLYKKEPEYDLQGLEDGDYREILEKCGELETKLDDDRVWLNGDDEEKGSLPKTKGGITKEVVQKGGGTEEQTAEFKLSAVRESLDYLLDFVDATPEFQRFHFTLKEMQQEVIKKQFQNPPTEDSLQAPGGPAEARPFRVLRRLFPRAHHHPALRLPPAGPREPARTLSPADAYLKDEVLESAVAPPVSAQVEGERSPALWPDLALGGGLRGARLPDHRAPAGGPERPGQGGAAGGGRAGGEARRGAAWGRGGAQALGG